MIGKEEFRVLALEEDAVVAERGGMPFVADEGDEILGVGILDHLLRFRPVLLVGLKAVDPLHVAVAGHFGHVVPPRMAGEGEEVEVRAR